MSNYLENFEKYYAIRINCIAYHGKLFARSYFHLYIYICVFACIYLSNSERENISLIRNYYSKSVRICFESISNCSESVPNYSKKIPQHTENIPNYSENIPKYSEIFESHKYNRTYHLSSDNCFKLCNIINPKIFRINPNYIK